MNVYTAIGRLGRDGEVRYTGDGKPVLAFAMAVDSGYGDKKQTLWVDCSLWGDRGPKIAEYVRKGDRIGVTGELGQREHNGKTYLTLRVSDVTLLGDKRDAAPKATPAKQSKGGNFEDDSEIPF